MRCRRVVSSPEFSFACFDDLMLLCPYASCCVADSFSSHVAFTMINLLLSSNDTLVVCWTLVDICRVLPSPQVFYK